MCDVQARQTFVAQHVMETLRLPGAVSMFSLFPSFSIMHYFVPGRLTHSSERMGTFWVDGPGEFQARKKEPSRPLSVLSLHVQAHLNLDNLVLLTRQIRPLLLRDVHGVGLQARNNLDRGYTRMKKI